MTEATSRPRARADAGFALLIVIWAVGLLALMFTTYLVGANYRSFEAASLAARARADTMAAAAIRIAVFDLLSGMADGKVHSARFPFNGAAVVCTLGERSRITISVVDEGGKVDLNVADPDIVRMLLRSLLRDQRRADQLAGRILEVRKMRAPQVADAGPGAGQAGRTGQAAGAGQVPGPGQDAGAGQEAEAVKMRSILELDQILEADRQTVLALLPMVTVHSGTPGVDAAVAPLDVLLALGQEGDAYSRAAGQRSLPAAFSSPSPGRIFTISAEAVTSSGARTTREAVVEFSPNVTNGHFVHEWRDGLRHLSDRSGGAIGLPPC